MSGWESWYEEFVKDSMSKKPKTDPLIRAAKKAYRSTALFGVDRLLKEQQRWQRKRTIADNKLSAVRRKIDAMLKELATPKTQ